MVELTVTMRIDTDRVYALEVTGENVLVDLIIHLDEVLQADFYAGFLENLPTNRLFAAKNSFEYEWGDVRIGLLPGWVSEGEWELLERSGDDLPF